MQLWPADTAGSPDTRDNLTAPYDIASLHQQNGTVGIGRHPAARMLDQNQVAKSLKLIARIGDNAVFRRFDRRSLPRGNINPVIVLPALSRAI